MKHIMIIAIFFSLLSWIDQNHASAAEDVPEAPKLEAEAALLMEAQSGQVLYSKNPDKKMYPASITKILTGIIAIESGKLDQVVTVSENAASADGTKVYLEPGEEKKLEDLVYGMLVNSGNDAAMAIAEYLGGSEAGFAKLMNLKARELGARHSHFVNPSGLPDEDHVTTAHDMALITRYAMEDATFRDIVATKEYPWEGDGWQPGAIVNHNRLLWDYEGATGVKNGYTKAAQQTFVATSERDGQQLIAVTLKVPGSANVLYRDLMRLMDYGYDAFDTHLLPVDEGRIKDVVIDGEVTAAHIKEKNVFVTLPKGASLADVEQKLILNEGLSLPIDKNDELGHVRVQLHQETIREIPVYATSAVKAVDAASSEHDRHEIAELSTEIDFPWALWVVSLLVFVWSLMYILKQRKRRREMRARLQAYRLYRG